MCDDLIDICPTAISALLLRLFQQETNSKGVFDPLEILRWWTKKIEEPDDSDAWINSSMWRLYARHIHALVATNVPCVADAVAYDLGIESPLIPKPELITQPDGLVGELWGLNAYGRSIPPFGFETWQPPLKLKRVYPCDEEDDFQNGSILPADEAGCDNQRDQSLQTAKV